MAHSAERALGMVSGAHSLHSVPICIDLGLIRQVDDLGVAGSALFPCSGKSSRCGWRWIAQCLPGPQHIAVFHRISLVPQSDFLLEVDLDPFRALSGHRIFIGAMWVECDEQRN